MLLMALWGLQAPRIRGKARQLHACISFGDSSTSCMHNFLADHLSFLGLILRLQVYLVCVLGHGMHACIEVKGSSTCMHAYVTIL